jgi:TatD DNase family protein
MTVEGPSLVDTHCHLTLRDYAADLEQVLQRAREAGIERIVVPGIDLASSRAAVALAETKPGVYATVGVHPHDAQTYSAALGDELRGLAGSPRVVAIGEIGLDYYRDRSPRPAQRTAFQAQLDLAAELGLPVVVHNRESTEDVMEALIHHARRRPSRLEDRVGVLHAFSADLEVGRRAAEEGFYLGVAGPLTYPAADERRAITSSLPLERLVLETDAPYLTPHPRRSERNEPAKMLLVAEQLAKLFGVSLEVIAGTTTANAARLFGWDDVIDHRHLL